MRVNRPSHSQVLSKSSLTILHNDSVTTPDIRSSFTGLKLFFIYLNPISIIIEL